ncbi:MAG: DNA repair protein RadA [Candidatus Magasanikbacteria bacterium CG_4_10_14_0_2_um_filter_33_14]|uniref:DNA repair protein RadA n=1 Tax=Candidatus Magasanikbacteria bacterium CG_4_10_14_0_2_um_filter_33_14 TaxID=1974636 RepID=A0A2M7VAU4_9BACT|nr:MAG: DNA repair protein RadA [Candidatus Magasanikbacteria bacterium CG_4_10_14_0_2_um_filter_33_14]
MSKPTTLFTCSKCDAQFTKWSGRCLECGQWGTITEQEKTLEKKEKAKLNYKATEIKSLNQINKQELQRISTKISELDRVLGSSDTAGTNSGFVPGSLVLLGGEPGIGKSTLSIQLASLISPTIYISGEESVEQIKMRADRLKIKSDKLFLANETNIETICATIEQAKPTMVIIDSIQTIYSEEVEGEAGNINQIRACTAKLLEVAKATNTTIIIIGHVTKEGTVAGPRTLEHMVDTVLYLEGDRHHSYRILRTVKNRFGATDEVGIFEMNELGLQAVKNPSACFLEEREDSAPGSVITCLMEGTRPMLIEIQALVNKTSFGFPVRKASGFDLNRLHVLTAVLQKRAGLNLGQYDIHINVVGGIRANEPAADLAVCLAIASSFKDKELGKDLVVFGEVGLGGEVRSIAQLEKRIKESHGLGMKRVITHLGKNKNKTDIKIIDVKNIAELIRQT